jgi:hypothetical protein
LSALHPSQCGAAQLRRIYSPAECRLIRVSFAPDSDRKADVPLLLKSADFVEKLDFLLRSQFLWQLAGFKKNALRVRQKR